MRWTPRRLKFALNWYPPYLGAGIRVDHVASDWRTMRVSMKLRWYNRNAVGTHFGGSLYSMADPQLMLMLMGILGRDYVVWLQSAEINYKKPGRGRVSVEFRISDDDLKAIEHGTRDGSPFRPSFESVIVDEESGVGASDMGRCMLPRTRPPRNTDRPLGGIASGAWTNR